MKGLLRKDFYMIWKYGRMLLLMSVVFLAVGTIGENDQNFFFLVYPVLFGGVLPVTLISYEERFGWDRMCDTMPVSRATVVDERYVCTLLCFLVIFFLTLLAQAAVKLPQGKGRELLGLAALLPSFGLAAPALMIPITLRFGVEKARIVYYVIIGVCVAVGLMVMSGDRSMGSNMGVANLLLVPLGTLAAFAVSWIVARKIYEKREL